MPTIDAQNILAFRKGIRTDTAATDSLALDLPVSGSGGLIIDSVVVYNASASGATATIGVFTGAGGTGTTVVADAALTGVTGPTIVSARTVAAGGTFGAGSIPDQLFVRTGTASGTAGTTIDVVIYGRLLP